MDCLGGPIVVTRKREADERETDEHERRSENQSAWVGLCLELLALNMEEGGHELSNAGSHWKLEKARK